MGWASSYISKLLEGRTVSFRPHGNSMTGRIESGQLVTVEPVLDHGALEVADVVLCKVKGSEYLHLIYAKRDGQFLIGNNHRRTNGWVSARSIYGKCVKVEA